MKSNKIILSLWLIALIVPAVCVIFGDWIISVIRNRPAGFETEPGISFIQFLIAAIPFIILASLASGKAWWKSSSATPRKIVFSISSGIIINLLLWGWFYIDAIYSSGKGVNFGIAFLLLFSPVIVGLVMLYSFRLAGRKQTKL